MRTLSIKAGLEASTVTPGSTAPDASLATPANPLAPVCARAAVAISTMHASVARFRTIRVRRFTFLSYQKSRLATQESRLAGLVPFSVAERHGGSHSRPKLSATNSAG